MAPTLSFLRLPVELRYIIYEHFVASKVSEWESIGLKYEYDRLTIPVRKRDRNLFQSGGSDTAKTQSDIGSLLRLNKQVHHEAIKIIYSRFRFDLQLLKAAGCRFIEKLSKETRRHIHHVSIDLDFYIRRVNHDHSKPPARIRRLLIFLPNLRSVTAIITTLRVLDGVKRDEGWPVQECVPRILHVISPLLGIQDLRIEGPWHEASQLHQKLREIQAEYTPPPVQTKKPWSPFNLLEELSCLSCWTDDFCHVHKRSGKLASHVARKLTLRT